MTNQPRPCKGLPDETDCPHGNDKQPWSGYCRPCDNRYRRLRYRRLRGDDVYGIEEQADELVAHLTEEPEGPRLSPTELAEMGVSRLGPPPDEDWVGSDPRHWNYQEYESWSAERKKVMDDWIEADFARVPSRPEES